MSVEKIINHNYIFSCNCKYLISFIFYNLVAFLQNCSLFIIVSNLMEKINWATRPTLDFWPCWERVSTPSPLSTLVLALILFEIRAHNNIGAGEASSVESVGAKKKSHSNLRLKLENSSATKGYGPLVICPARAGAGKWFGQT